MISTSEKQQNGDRAQARPIAAEQRLALESRPPACECAGNREYKYIQIQQTGWMHSALLYCIISPVTSSPLSLALVLQGPTPRRRGRMIASLACRRWLTSRNQRPIFLSLP